MTDEFDERIRAAATADEAGNEAHETPETESDVLRSELIQAQEKLEALTQLSEENHSKFMRARAELETYRRRSAADTERARASGQDSAVETVLRVFDDLERALQVSGDADAGAVLDGVRLVLENLEADLGKLGIERVGAAGEQFDPELHEALTALPVTEGQETGTIAQVVKVGFSQGDRLIRPAAVVVYND